MTPLSDKFNAEQLLANLNRSATAQIEALQSDKGIARTFIATAKHSFALVSSAKKLAKIFGIPADKGVTNEVFDQIAAKAKEQGIPGGERLEQIMEWNKKFWSQPDVKAADTMRGHPIKSARIIKGLAQKQQKP